ncbi:uncharacterized protein LOC113360299 [Papaver somniferum]|uniref:uncharacterized protein LOC113360299 n=1 Tax=Papaver somniferum TaxID=3469 RepID=UPI000E702C7F|nr:uncharacterized protein LOC113360299 [Papaver somniferum]
MNLDGIRVPVVYEPTRFYVAMVGLGTFPGIRPPFMNYYLMVDSGSDQTWLQCEGATKDFNQNMPLYPWRSSTTYRHVPCNTHPLCKGDKCNADGECTYLSRYASGSVTSGIVAKEKFTLRSGTGGLEKDISVANKRVRFPRGTFKLNSQGKGGTIIDSGTPISMMYKDHFDRVADLVKAHFNELGIEYIGSIKKFDVCFRLRGRFDISNYPSITLHFQQADYIIQDYRANFLMATVETVTMVEISEADSDFNLPVVNGVASQMGPPPPHPPRSGQVHGPSAGIEKIFGDLAASSIIIE